MVFSHCLVKLCAIHLNGILFVFNVGAQSVLTTTALTKQDLCSKKWVWTVKMPTKSSPQSSLWPWLQLQNEVQYELLYSHEEVSALLLILAIKHWFFNTLKNVLRFEKSKFFDKFLLRIMGNSSKRVFVQKFQLTLILQGFKVWDMKKRAFY